LLQCCVLIDRIKTYAKSFITFFMYAVIGSQVDKSDVEISSKVLETNFSPASQVSHTRLLDMRFSPLSISVCLNLFLICQED